MSSRVVSQAALSRLLPAVLIGAAFASPAVAVPLIVGGAPVPAVGEPEPVAGAPIASLTQNFSGLFGGFSGTVTSDVYFPDTSNPLGGYTFVYTVRSDATSANAIDRVTFTGFSNVNADGSYGLLSAGAIPSTIELTAAGVVGFDFDLNLVLGSGPIAPGQTSRTLIVQTNAQSFAVATANIIDGDIAATFTYAPNAVPAPGVLALLGLGGVVAVRRRR